jgi:hypothetical protein
MAVPPVVLIVLCLLAKSQERISNFIQRQGPIPSILNKFIYLRSTVTKQNYIEETFKNQLNSRDNCCHSFQNDLSLHVPPKDLNIQNKIPIKYNF